MATMLPPSVISGAAAARQRHQRIGADVVRDAIGLAAGVYKFAFEGVLGRKGHRMQQQVQFAELFADGLEHPVNVFVLGHVAGQNQGVRAERCRPVPRRFP